MNNKILSVVLVAGIATTGFAGISAANNSGSLLSSEKSEMRELFQKVKSGETLTSDEQALVDQAKANFSERGFKRYGKRAGFHNLTDEEKTALESMTDEEKQVFFEEKRAEMQAEREAHKAVIDKLIAGESLSAAEEALRLEMLAKFEDENNEHPVRRGNGDIIAKLLAGDELTDEEIATLEEMQAKHAEREAQRAILQPIMEKLKAGEELTEEEQAILEEHKAERGEKRGKGHR